MFSLPTLQELSSVHAALRWLLDVPAKITDRNVFVRARLSGLIVCEARGHWRADGIKATRLVKVALKRLPRNPVQLGTILHGLGEIDARSHAGFTEALIDYLRRRRPRCLLIQALNAAVECEGRTLPPVRLETLSFAQWILRAQLDWNTFYDAVRHIKHPYEHPARGDYGLRFAAQVILAVDPATIDSWIVGHPTHPGLATIGDAALWLAFPGRNSIHVSRLLKSRIVAIKCLAAASLVCPQGQLSSSLNFCDCWTALIEGGIDPGDATWMIGFRIKETIHQRYRLEHRREQCDTRLLHLERNPDAAIGGCHNADAELRALRNQCDDASGHYLRLLLDLEAMLSDMAASWPPEGLANDQMAALDNVFVDTPEIRHRLAEKLPHPANRDWLLKRNIAQLVEFIGLENPVEAFKYYFHPDNKRFVAIAPWAAQSLVLLYSGDRRGIGKRTSDLVSELAEASKALLAQPFIAARQPVTWQSAVTRAACADLFVLMVVDSMLKTRRGEVARLNELAIEHAFTILCGPLPEQNSLRVFDQLASRAVYQMTLCQTSEDLRRQWGRAEDLPDFPRALALWSSPILVEQHKELASALFRRVGQLPLSNKYRNQQFSRILSVLDCAIASCAIGGRRDLISRITDLWDESYKDWQAITDRWAHAATMLVAAVEKDGAERAAMLAEISFAQSYCRQLIETAQQ